MLALSQLQCSDMPTDTTIHHQKNDRLISGVNSCEKLGGTRKTEAQAMTLDNVSWHHQTKPAAPVVVSTSTTAEGVTPPPTKFDKQNHWFLFVHLTTNNINYHCHCCCGHCHDFSSFSLSLLSSSSSLSLKSLSSMQCSCSFNGQQSSVNKTMGALAVSTTVKKLEAGQENTEAQAMALDNSALKHQQNQQHQWQCQQNNNTRRSTDNNNIWQAKPFFVCLFVWQATTSIFLHQCQLYCMAESSQPTTIFCIQCQNLCLRFNHHSVGIKVGHKQWSLSQGDHKPKMFQWQQHQLCSVE